MYVKCISILIKLAAFKTWRTNATEQKSERQRVLIEQLESIAISYDNGNAMRHAWNDWTWLYDVRMEEKAEVAMVIIFLFSRHN